MTRLLQCGWETGDVNQIGTATGIGGQTAPAVVSSTPAPRSGTYCLKCGNNDGATSGWGSRGVVLLGHATKTELYWAFGIYRNDSEGGTFPNRVVWFTYDSAGAVGLWLTAEPDGSMRMYSVTAGGASPSSASVTLLGTSSITVGANTWTLIEIHATAATGATGTLELRINGVSAMSLTNVRTCQSSANFVGMGLQFSRMQAVTPGSTATYIAFDDLRVNDTAGSLNTSWCGDESIYMLLPTSAGDSTQFTRGGTDSGANYGQVDEIPPSTTDYVYDTVVGHMDLYNLGTATITSVSAVEVLARAYNVDGAGGSLNVVTKTGAGQSDGTAQTLTGQPRYLRRLLETDPADSAAWSQTKIDALQIGVKVAS